MSKPTLNFISLGGVDEVTKNLYLYEAAGEILIVDCGIGFPAETVWGVDLVIPDTRYLRSKKKAIKGILITHAHEDHFGALPYLLPKLGYPPIWSTCLVAGFIENKLKEFKLSRKSQIKIIDPDRDETYSIGRFKVTPFRVNHSVPDTVGFAIDTPVGRVFHIADFKFDWEAVSGQRFDVQRLVSLTKQQPILLVSDCLGVNHPGYTQPEKEIEVALDQIIGRSKKKVFFTTLSSNISRIQQAVNVARRNRRSLVTLGRSISDNVEIARRLGYLDLKDGELVPEKQASHRSSDRLVYLIAGSYGQENSALSRLAWGKHPLVKATPGDTVIFSADPAPPGTRAQVDLMVDRLVHQGLEVHYYDIQENLYVSGHGSRGDLALLINLTKPRYLIPIGGTPRHLHAYKSLVGELNVGEKVLILSTGEVSTITPDGVSSTGKIALENIYIDGKGVGDLNETVIGERQRLGREGLVVVVVSPDQQSGQVISQPIIKLQGLTKRRYQKEIIREAKELVLGLARGIRPGDFQLLSKQIETKLAALFTRKWDRQPRVIVIINS